MKKFTNISNSTVGVEKEVKIDEKEQQEILFKHQIMKLMDDFLTIQSYGSARPEIMIPTRIVGKELFVEALQDLLSQKENKEIVKVLESIKEKTKDWKSIDETIDDLEIGSRKIKFEQQIKNIVEKWGSDHDSFLIYLENYKLKLNEKSKDLVISTLNRMIQDKQNQNISEKLIEMIKIID